eukprot:467966-Prorocentrum_minimum.AAC.1
MRMLRAAMRMIRAVMWMLRANMWMLRAIYLLVAHERGRAHGSAPVGCPRKVEIRPRLHEHTHHLHVAHEGRHAHLMTRYQPTQSDNVIPV